jgi:hypothetical protein
MKRREFIAGIGTAAAWLAHRRAADLGHPEGRASAGSPGARSQTGVTWVTFFRWQRCYLVDV